MCDNKNYIVYKITNDINKKIYIGCHVTDDINDNYMGSGTNIKKAIKKFGRENFTKEILYNFDNKEEMLDMEKELVNRDFITEDTNYNIIVGGGQFLATDTVTVRNSDGEYLQVHKEDPRYLSGELIPSTTGVVVLKDLSGNTILTTKNDPRYLSGELVGYTKGMIMVKDTYNKSFMVSINDPRYLSGELNREHPFLGKNHTDESKKKIGAITSIHQKGKGNSQYGTCWITNGVDNKKINKDDFIPHGWNMGRTLNKSINYCKCGEIINRRSKQCKTCYSYSRRTVDRPSYEELTKNINELGRIETGEKYNVSVTTIRKWMKMYERELSGTGT